VFGDGLGGGVAKLNRMDGWMNGWDRLTGRHRDKYADNTLLAR